MAAKIKIKDARPFYRLNRSPLGVLAWLPNKLFGGQTYEDFCKIHLFCDKCDKYISSDFAWVCSFCDAENETSSFLEKCPNCTRLHLSVECPHCGHSMALDDKDDTLRPAKIRVKSKDKMETAAHFAAEETRYRERKAQVEREIELTQLTAQLEQLKQSIDFQKEVSARARLEKSFDAHDAHMMGVYTIAREQKAKAAEKYRSDPETLQMAHESIEARVQKVSD